MTKIKVYRTLFEAMIALANKKNQMCLHVIKDDNGWYQVVKKTNHEKTEISRQKENKNDQT